MTTFPIWTVGRVLLAAFLLGWAVAPDSAQGRTIRECEKRQLACGKRCLDRYPNDSDQQVKCLQRTCNKQFENCLAQVEAKPATGGIQQDDAQPGAGRRHPSGARPDGKGVLR